MGTTTLQVFSNVISWLKGGVLPCLGKINIFYEKRRKSVVVVTFFGPWTTGHDMKKNELKCTNLLDNKNTLNINFLYIRVANNSYFTTLNFHVKKIFFKNIKSCRRANLPKIWAPLG
jgi:hypothetical protein